MHRTARGGFTLTELLVVIGIIAAIIIMITPSMQRAVVKGKEQAVISNCGLIKSSLASYAQRNGGNYPGLALELGYPVEHQRSEGSQSLTTQVIGDPLMPNPNGLAGDGFSATGVIGGEGQRSTLPGSTGEKLDEITQRMARFQNSGDTTAKGEGWWRGNIEPLDRYLDVLMVSDVLDAGKYPHNPFRKGMFASGDSMRNIYCSRIEQALLLDYSAASWDDAEAAWIYCSDNDGNHAGVLRDNVTGSYLLDANALLTNGDYFGCGAIPDAATGQPTANMRYFSEGDFAYVPLLTTSVYPLNDPSDSLSDTRYRWGSRVGAYLLFGYGNRNGSNDKFADQQAAFADSGLPGYGDAGIDTPTERVVLSLFEGAIYFEAEGLTFNF